ncbi:Tetratricopeptide repeat protein [Rubripirellula tenax]|uniref:Tetratricopeptide repeat protein n=1 Tax=Rubripirellula tenax TaxID=2528015 RepID=A0A5C6EG68_9BACT|nr:tetratricopeptide repeat protein [Rubripirellula tenax]TWU47560.1 Tetratricopeptide repeat protein [Rubripirellula tenax]
MKRFLLRFLKFSPVILVILLVGGLIVRAVSKKDDIASEYRVAARQAVADKDLDQAKFYYSRLVGSGDRGSEQDQMNWVSILDASGDTQAAREMLERMAPDDSVGFASAHRQKAIMIGAAIAREGTSPERVEQLQWHLRHGARDSTPENDILWANYHLAVEQVDKAVDKFESAASRKPELWFDISNLYRRLGRTEEANRASKRAQDYSAQILQSEPTNIGQRLRLLVLLANEKKFDQVEAILGEGLRLNSDNIELRNMASNLTLIRLEEIKDDTLEAKRNRLTLFAQAAKLNPSNPNVYKVLNQLYALSDSKTEQATIRDQLEKWITDGHAVPMAHFTLGNLLWQESDTKGAVFHLEAALKIDPSLAIVANNLAWVLSQAEEPDFERAEELIKMAMETAPKNHSFRDTMATVLFEQEKYKEALPYLEHVLPHAVGEKKAKLHEQLAIVYESLGQESMAKRHREQSVAGEAATETQSEVTEANVPESTEPDSTE